MVKISQSTLHETRDKRPFGRDLGRNLGQRHISVKLFLVAAHGSMDIGDSI